MSRGQKENYSAQLKKGVLEMLVLFLLSQQDLYGYQLCQKLVTGSKGLFPITENSLYPVLYRLVRDHHVSHWKEENVGRPRVFYHLEDSGREIFDKIGIIRTGRDTVEVNPHLHTGVENIFHYQETECSQKNTAPLQEEFPVESFFFRIDETDFPS